MAIKTHDCLRENYILARVSTFGAFLKLPSTKIQFHFLVSRSLSDEYFHLHSNTTTKSDRLLAYHPWTPQQAPIKYLLTAFPTPLIRKPGPNPVYGHSPWCSKSFPTRSAHSRSGTSPTPKSAFVSCNLLTAAGRTGGFRSPPLPSPPEAGTTGRRDTPDRPS